MKCFRIRHDASPQKVLAEFVLVPSGLCREAAIGHQDLAGDVGRLRRGQEGDRLLIASWRTIMATAALGVAESASYGRVRPVVVVVSASSADVVKAEPQLQIEWQRRTKSTRILLSQVQYSSLLTYH